MNGLSSIFVFVAFVAILSLPRRWVCLPFLAGACYITYGQGLDIGPFTFYVIRLLLLAGFIRILVRRERLDGGLIGLDWIVLAWSGIAILSSVGHEDPSAALVFRLGFVYDCAGTYFLFRVFIRSVEEFVFVCKITAIMLVPVALEMFSERMTGQNRFAVLGGVPETCQVREGRIRAQGPFMHPILAGTVGAICLPLMVGIWKQDRRVAAVGLGAAVMIVMASGSSGPMMSAIFAACALYFWRFRAHMRRLRWFVVFLYLGLNLVMKVPAYYLLARFDLAGGSTGWHRAELIDSAIRHLGEWWLIGTDYTRHWMPTGVTWSVNHTDITNHYLSMGVMGGLPLLFLFVGTFVVAFKYVGSALISLRDSDPERRFLVWALGASLFANAATCISVSYFDQSFLFLYLSLGAIGSLKRYSTLAQQNSEKRSFDESSEECQSGPIGRASFAEG